MAEEITIEIDGSPYTLEELLAMENHQELLKKHLTQIQQEIDSLKVRLSDCKKTDLKLMINVATISAIIEASPEDSMIIIETNGTIASINPVGASRFNMEVREMLGKNILDCLANIAPDQIEERKARIQRILQSKEMMIYEDRISGNLYEDGKPRWFILKQIPIPNEDDEIERIVLLGRDITQQKIVEIALDEYKDICEAFCNNSRDMIIITNTNGIITKANGVIDEVLGFKEIIGRHIQEILVPEDYIAHNYHEMMKNARVTGDTNAPKLIDERRKAQRGTKNLKIRFIDNTDNQVPCIVSSSGIWEKETQNQTTSEGWLRNCIQYKGSIIIAHPV